MRKLLAVLALVACGLGAVPAAQADSPHFIKASASINNSGQLVCTFKEAGLGNTLTTANISCSADATAVYQCFNKRGHHPQAITVSPPGPGSFSCPNGQTLFLQAVSYTNIVLSGEGATADVPGTLTATVHIPV